jgi:hypothetical protein
MNARACHTLSHHSARVSNSGCVKKYFGYSNPIVNCVDGKFLVFVDMLFIHDRTGYCNLIWGLVLMPVCMAACVQLYAMPVFDMLETVLVKKLHLPPSALLRIVTRCSYVLATAFVACTLPFFSDLLGFLGGFAFAPTTYFLPCIIWLKVKKPKRFSPSWLINWILIFLGVCLASVATVGGMRQIIVDASTYKFYQ